MTSNSNTIIGAVIGDVIGSVFEWNNIKTTQFDLFNPKCDFTVSLRPKASIRNIF